MSKLAIASCNCQGLGDYQKRRDVFQYLRQKKFSIYLLQDTHIQPSLEKQIRSEWGYECYFASNNSQSRGVAVLFSNNFDFKVNKVIKDTEGNFIIIKLKTMGKDILLINIYGPNRDNPNFYENIQKHISDFNNCSTIIAGDWNLVLNPTLDYFNYKHNNNPKAQEKVIQMSNDLELVDIWREINPEVERYTWRRPNPPQQARLDFFLISDNLLSYIKDADILYGYRTDHSLITLQLEFLKRGKAQNIILEI